MKPKLLCILHRSPPSHGAAKVGDFISESQKLHEKFDCKFITIKSSETIGDIGKINFKKFYFVLELYVKIFWMLIVFRPDKLYFTSSIRGVAFYRDLLVSSLWKIYKLFRTLDIYYHYHTKGINEFVSNSKTNLLLTNLFLKDVSLILLSPMLKNDFKQIDTYKQILFLPNGVENNYTNNEFNSYIDKKQFDKINILYLAHMMKDKGYWDVLKLATKIKDKNIHYHFAGSWKNKDDEKEFFHFVRTYKLEDKITYHGFVKNVQKDILLKKSHMLVYPSKNDAFPLTILEAFSYGLPVVATNEGSIPFIIDNNSGIVVKNINDLPQAFDKALNKFINKQTAEYCRKRYLDNFSLEQFEEKLIKVLK